MFYMITPSPGTVTFSTSMTTTSVLIAGTLSLYNAGNPKKIDDDVFALITVNEYGIRRRYYYVITH